MLTQEQIDLLFSFVEKKGVKYYDIKMELIDHLSEAVEAEMKKQPDFNLALNNVYKSFGIFGFNKVIEQKTAVVEKHFKKEYNNYFDRYFTLPKIIATLFIFFVFIYIGHH